MATTIRNKKSQKVKQGIAAAIAAVCLLGGAGSLAYWTNSTDLAGTSITSGHLKCDVTDAGQWTMDGGKVFDPASDRLVPGDVLTKVFRLNVSGTGYKLQAQFQAANPTWRSDNAHALTLENVLSASYSVNGNQAVPGNSTISVSPGDQVTATWKITWPYGVEDNDSNSLSDFTAGLNDLTSACSQVSAQAQGGSTTP